MADAIQMTNRPRVPADCRCQVIGEQDLIVHPTAKIQPGAVLDAGIKADNYLYANKKNCESRTEQSGPDRVATLRLSINRPLLAQSGR